MVVRRETRYQYISIKGINASVKQYWKKELKYETHMNPSTLTKILVTAKEINLKTCRVKYKEV